MTSDIFFTKEADLHKWKLMEIANTPHTAHTHTNGQNMEIKFRWFFFVLVMMVDGQNENEKKMKLILGEKKLKRQKKLVKNF